MTREQAINIIERVDICANAAETARDMAIAALREPVIVRCKDCKWAEYGKDYESYCNHWKSGLYANIKDDDFCSYGERKDNERKAD